MQLIILVQKLKVQKTIFRINLSLIQGNNLLQNNLFIAGTAYHVLSPVSILNTPPPPPPPFWGIPKLHKEGKKSRVCTQMHRVLVVNSNPDTPPPLPLSETLYPPLPSPPPPLVHTASPSIPLLRGKHVHYTEHLKPMRDVARK